MKTNEFKKVFSAKTEGFRSIKEVIIDTDYEILFPNSYIPQIDEDCRYKRLAKIENDKDLHSFKNRIIDRFGDSQ